MKNRAVAGKPTLSKTAKDYEQSESWDKSQSAPSLNIDTKRNWINEYNWKVIEVILSDSSKCDELNCWKPLLNTSKNLKHSSTSKWLNDSIGLKFKNNSKTRNDNNFSLNKNDSSIRNKLSFITKSWNQTKTNFKDANKKLNDIISLQKQFEQTKDKKQTILNASQENRMPKSKNKQEEVVSSDDDSISAPNSNIGPMTKQKPYTSFIDWAHKRKENANEAKITLQQECWVSPISGLSKRQTQISNNPNGRNLIPIFSSNVKTIESKCKEFNLTLGQSKNTSSKENKALHTTGKKKDINHLERFNQLVTNKTVNALEVNQSNSIVYELSTGLQSVTKTLLESQQK